MSKHYVYILRSESDPAKHYVGQTEDLEKRIKQHNNGDSAYTNKYKPWIVETHIVFLNKKLAKQFEKYLKTGSGKVFLKRRLMREGKKAPKPNNIK